MENSRRGRDQAHGPTPPVNRQIQPQFRGPRINQQEIRPPRVEEVGQISNIINSLERDSRGQSTELLSNYFPITTYTDWNLYQYRVDFNPVQERKNIQRELLNTYKKFLGAYIFDETMLLSTKKFESDTTELISKQNTDDQSVIITLKFTSVIKEGDYTSIRVFNFLMRKCFGNLNLTLIGRNYYDADVKKHSSLLCNLKIQDVDSSMKSKLIVDSNVNYIFSNASVQNETESSDSESLKFKNLTEEILEKNPKLYPYIQQLYKKILSDTRSRFNSPYACSRDFNNYFNQNYAKFSSQLQWNPFQDTTPLLNLIPQINLQNPIPKPKNT